MQLDVKLMADVIMVPACVTRDGREMIASLMHVQTIATIEMVHVSRTRMASGIVFVTQSTGVTVVKLELR